MKHSYPSRMIAAILVAALMLGLVPTTALAAQDVEIPSIIEYKAMSLVNLMGGQWVSRYDYAQANNTFYKDAAVNLNIPSLVRIGFTIEKSQYVDLVLYKLDESVVQQTADGNSEAHLEYYFDPEAEDLGASFPEEFLKEKIGYINGIQISDNIVNPDENAEEVEYRRITDDEWETIKDEAASGQRLSEPMKGIYAYGFKGQKLIFPAATSTFSLTAEETGHKAPVELGEDDQEMVAEQPAGEEAINQESPAAEEALEAENIEPAVQDEEPAQVENYVEAEIEGENGPSQISALPISDVLYDPNPISTFAARRAPRANDEWAIENYVLWDGSVVTDNGTVVEPAYEDGYYVIVLEPCLPEAAVYNSFLGFESTTMEREEYPMMVSFKEALEIIEADETNSEDPVNLLTGSFNWNYTDMALYGDEDLPFTRYYESTSADKNYGLGNGWTTDFTADLNVQKFFAEVHLAKNHTFYFNMDFDGEYRACGDWTFCWNGNGYTLENTMTNTAYNFNKDKILESIVEFGKTPLIFTNDGTHITGVTKGTNQFTFAYNADGNLSTVTDSVGRSITLSYDGDLLTSVENPDGDSLIYTYTADGYVETVKNFKGQVYVENTYDTNGRVIHQFAADMGTFDFTYDVESRHNTCTGTDGYLLEIWYDELHRITKSANAAGAVSYTYNDQNQVTSQTDREGNTTYYEHDANGNISKITYADGTRESYTYDDNRQVTAYTDRNGASVTYTYNAKGKVTSMTDGRGNTTTYTYKDGFLASVTDPEGNVTQYTNDAKGNRTSMTDAKGNTTTYAYDTQGRLVSQTDAKGNVTTYAYTEAGKLVKITDAQGNELAYTVDGNGFNTSESDWMGHVTTYERNIQNQVTKVTDPLGNVTSYAYDDRGNLSVATDANGNKTTYGYDAAGRMVSMTDAKGNTWTYAYDNEGRVTSITDPAGGKTATAYDEVGRTTSTTDAKGAKTSYTYDNAGNTTAVKDALGHSTAMTYDANGNLTSRTDRNGGSYAYDKNDRLTSETDALGGVTTYTYDELGNVTKTVTPGGAATSRTYDELGRATSSADALGHVTTMTYDTLGRVTSVAYADGSSVSYTYDANGQILTATDELGGVTAYTYDAKGQVTSITDPMDGKTTYAYDAMGQVSTITDPLGFVTTYTYNELNTVATVTDANGGVTTYAYDALGRIASITDAKGGKTSYTYDAVDNRTGVTDAEGNQITYTYDLLGRTTSMTDAEGNNTVYSYDNEGNQTAITDALDGKQTMSYDALGRMVGMTDKNGHTWSYTYDADSRMTASTDPLGGVTAYTYDALGQLTAKTTPMGFETAYAYDTMGRNTSVTNALGNTTAYTYDAKGQVTAVTQMDGTIVSYVYDANGNVLSITDEMEHILTYTYDADNRLTSSTDANGGVTAYTYDSVGNILTVTDPMGFVTSYTYDANNNVTTVTFPDDTQTSYSYDKLGQVTQTTDALGAVTTYAYDGNGNMVKATDAEGYTVSYAYDKVDRLTAVTDARGNVWTFAYDAEGNLTTAADPLEYSASRTYDALGHLVSETDKNGNTWSYVYDADGRMTSATDPLGNATTYTYDALGQMTSVTTPMGNQTAYTYDAMGRQTKTVDPMGHTTTFVYDALGRVVKVTNKDGSVASSTYDANGNLLSSTDVRGNTVSYTYDANGRMTSVTDAMGGVTRYAYDKVGNLISTTDALGNVTAQSYDKVGNLISTTDAEGNITAYTYDKDGRCVSITDPNGGVIRAEYDGNGNIVKLTDAEDNITTYTYNARNELVSYTDAEGYTFSYTYDGNGNVVATTDGNGNVTRYVYDGLDRAVERLNAEGNSATNTYDADGRLIQAVNEEGGVTAYTYDKDGRITAMTDALGNVTAFEYDAMDRVTKVTDALDNETTYTYDAAGNVLTATNAKGVTTTYTYDANGNLLTVTDAAGTTTYVYDALNRVTSVTDRRGNTQNFTYDALGRITKVTDKNGNSTSYTYDGNGNIVTTTDALGTVARFEYNANDQLVKMTQTRADTVSDVTEEQVTLYEYDGRNLVTKVIKPTGANELYVYDGNGNMISKTDGDGYVTEYSYNSLDLVSKINYNDAKEVTYQYNKVGELVKMDDWLGETTFELDLLGRMTKATDHKGNAVQYTYDAVGNQTSLTYPDGGVATRTYDAIGELLTVTDPEKGVYSYEYDDAGNVTRLTYPNGWIEDYTYDAEGNLTKVVDTDPFVMYNKTSTKYEYDYDAEGNLTREYDRDSGETKRAQTSTYTYDALNRLTHVTETSRGYPTVERAYIYDTLGNMIQEEADECLEYHFHGTTLYESQECCDRAEYNGTKRWDYTYDGRGNLVSVDKYMRTTQGMQMVNSEKYVYDETGKLVQGTNENGEVSLYTYNGLGVRVGRELIVKDNTHGYTDFHKETPSVETGLSKPEVVKESYVVDYTRSTLDTLVKEEVGGNTDRWLYGLQSLQVKITSEGTDWWGQQTQQDVLTAYTHHDRLGSIVNLTDQYGRNLVRADYREYGEIAFYDSITVNGGYRRIAPQLVYTNHEWDDVLKLYYAKARFYDPDEKRFLSTDPVKGKVIDPLSLVPYLYCVDNPLRWVDPLGLKPLRVKKNNASLRAILGTSGSVVDSLKKGTIVNDVSANYPWKDGQQWARVEYADIDANAFKFAWISMNDLEDPVVKVGKGKKYTVNVSDRLNIRKWPATYARKVGSLMDDSVVISVGEEYDDGTYTWIKVEYKGKDGKRKEDWVAKEYLALQVTTTATVATKTEPSHEATSSVDSTSANQSTPQKQYMAQIYCPGGEYTTTKGKLTKSLNDLLFYQENYLENPELYHVRANDIRNYLQTFAYEDPFVVEYMETSNVLWELMKSSQGSSAEDTRLVLADIQSIRHENFEGSAHDMGTAIAGGIVAVTGVYYVGVPAAKIIASDVAGALSSAGSSVAITSTTEAASKVVEAFGQKHHILSNRIMRAIDANPALRGAFDRASSIVQALTLEAHKGYQSWHRAIDDEMVYWIENSANVNVHAFWEKMYSLYNTDDMIGRFGSAALDYIKRMMQQ